MDPQRGPRTIYINGRFLEQPLSGVQRYAREVVTALDDQLAIDARPGERWCLLTTGGAMDCPRLARIEVRTVHSRLRGHVWEQVALARAARGGALVGLAGSGPLSHDRQLVVIHDANVFRNPDFFSFRYGLWHRCIDRALARRARIATVSHFSGHELADVLGLQANGIPVIYNGSDHMRRLTPSLATWNQLKLEGRPYFVLLGNLTKNKNVAVAIDALKHVPDALLVLVGGLDAKVFSKGGNAAVSDRVILAGRIDDANVAGLLGRARALLFPSLYEGFGIPPLEAMVNGCPVIASAIPAVQEVCQNAALYFNPRDPGMLAQVMQAVLDESLSERAVRELAGSARAATYTWERSARALMDFCRRNLLNEGQE